MRAARATADASDKSRSSVFCTIGPGASVSFLLANKQLLKLPDQILFRAMVLDHNDERGITVVDEQLRESRTQVGMESGGQAIGGSERFDDDHPRAVG